MSLHLRSSMRDPQFAQTRISSPGSLKGCRTDRCGRIGLPRRRHQFAWKFRASVKQYRSAKPVVAATGEVASRRVCPVFESDYYKILEVDPEADPDVIAAAYRVLAKRVRAKDDLEEADQIRLAELEPPTPCCRIPPSAVPSTRAVGGHGRGRTRLCPREREWQRPCVRCSRAPGGRAALRTPGGRAPWREPGRADHQLRSIRGLDAERDRRIRSRVFAMA